MQVAQVIVDVPARQTNSPFSYSIPDHLADQIQPGMRVQVPFGNRKITGFVVGFSDSSSFNGKLKPIADLIDLYPVVNSELLKLAEWLADQTYSFKISCLQTMLPGGMRTKNQKKLIAKNEQVCQQYPEIFQGQPEVEYDRQKYNNQVLAEILNLQKAGDIQVEYDLTNRARPIMRKAYRGQLNDVQIDDALKTVRKNARGQIQLLNLLKTHQNETLLVSKWASLGVTSATLKAAEKKGWVASTLKRHVRNPFLRDVAPSQPFKLQPDQQAAVDSIEQAVVHKKDQVFLLEGVTGSGKTEVYLQSIAHALELGRTALMLVPEITLTPQIVGRIRSRFGDQVAMLHSAMSSGERYDEWQRINQGKAKVVVGVRSAVFAPLSNIGLIIMDEEHDSSYKQADNPRYQTRDVAKWRAAYNNCPVVLGSATPSLESRARAMKGVYTLLKLPHRINQHALPHVSIIDMKTELAKHHSALSTKLADAIQVRLDKHEQVILLLNRRGYSAFLMCRDCGYVPRCPNCDISLTMHKNTHTLNCHYCGHKEPVPTVCPQCHSKRIRFYGMGSEQLEEQVKDMFPTARVLRMDVDTTRKKGSHEAIIDQFGAHKADILLGTQMIAKGLDFPEVTLVGVLNADSALQFPDFRSSERTFELLTQVSGRSGRADKTGEVIIQTFNPDHYAIQLAKTQDYEKFYATEMRVRHDGKYPPYYYTVKLTGNSPSENQTASEMFGIMNFLKKQLSPQAIILGPTPKTITRIDNRYYYQIIIKYRKEPQLKATLDEILVQSQKKQRQGLQIAIDNEPLDFM
ncbi:primosomal protein N' [Lentilactobacillus buchneri]|uniref:primosomal protein N' n=1 Tax=Lentilactobacillus buchneri TaxID=1581 RepID=UPI00129273BD|nr:primosomal protein N' [Lentilactobacillus buchneri]MQM77647.1 primosomal protein N' [Lentilactobacillus buchneri]MQM87717.1 primosomal protein N' [Lentilactobacillus buchneri]MQN22175.1 primosomal protein N' [Lentilactobacillus buchneri]